MARGHLPLLIDQQQDKREAEDSHDAGTRGQGCSCDAWKDKSSWHEVPLPTTSPRGKLRQRITTEVRRFYYIGEEGWTGMKSV